MISVDEINISRIYLIGMMGAGKTTIGDGLAKELDYKFVDLDKEIEKSQNCSISSIFENKGEEYFRKIEQAFLEDTKKYNNAVISTGGGIIKKKENIHFLKKQFSIYLKASKEVLLDRLKNDTQRPLIQGGDLEKKIEDLIKERENSYIQASRWIIESKNEDKEELIRLIKIKLGGLI